MGVRKIILPFVIICSAAFVYGLTPPVADKGVLDAREWDFAADGTLELKGQWEFYWKQFLPPEEFTAGSGEKDFKADFLNVPGYWNGSLVDGSPLPGQGYATFHLKVLLPKTRGSFAIGTREIQTAYRLYVNGNEVAAVGRAGTNAEGSSPRYLTVVAEFPVDGDVLDIVVAVSNFEHVRGGIWEGLRLGRERDIRSSYEKALNLDIFLFGSILIIGLYHLGLFIHRRRDFTSLNFGLFCTVIALRLLVTGNMYLYRLLPGVDWQILVKLEYLTFYLALPLFFMYIKTLFPRTFSLTALRSMQAAAAAFSLFVIAAPPKIFIYSLQIYQFITVVSGFYFVYLLFRAFKEKQRGSLILSAGFLILFGIVINDILHANQIVHTGYYMPLGLYIFIFSQAYLIAARFTKVFKTAENQRIELIQTNASYLKEITERMKLEKDLLKSHEQVELSRAAIILGLAKLAEYRDGDTGLHLERIREYSRILAKGLSRHAEYVGYISETYIQDLYHSSILHDIGKVGVPDSILLKPGKLTSEEFEVIKRHSTIGGDSILNVESKMNKRSFLTLGREIAYFHHEKWDGSGYPKNLQGKDIPLSARLVAVADVYDALVSERPYKTAFSHEKAVEIIREGSGSHFDPIIVNVFLYKAAEFDAIRQSGGEPSS